MINLSRDMTCKANKVVKEQILFNCVSCEIVIQPLHPDASAPLREVRVITVREEPNSHPQFCQQDITDGMRSHWISCSRGVKESSGGGQKCAEN